MVRGQNIIIEDTHPAIVSKDIFDRVQEKIKRRERIVCNDDGSIEASKRKFNRKVCSRQLISMCGLWCIL